MRWEWLEKNPTWMQTGAAVKTISTYNSLKALQDVAFGVKEQSV